MFIVNNRQIVRPRTLNKNAGKPGSNLQNCFTVRQISNWPGSNLQNHPIFSNASLNYGRLRPVLSQRLGFKDDQ